MEIATGAAQPMVGRDRESVVIYQMATKEDQFTHAQVAGFVGLLENTGVCSSGFQFVRRHLECERSKS